MLQEYDNTKRRQGHGVGNYFIAVLKVDEL